MLNLTHYIPILSAIVSLIFAWVLFRHWQRKPGALHLAWWTLGVFLYAAGTITEGLTALLGWHQLIFKLWYIVGAIWGAAPLAQGTVYLLLPRKAAHVLSVILLAYCGVASVCILLSPVNLALVDPTRLSGAVLAWQWVRILPALPNTYALVFLVGGALWSAWYFRRKHASNRVWGNVLIAVGALLPGIGGSYTTQGYVEVLFITEFIGILLIWAGYYLIERYRVPSAEPAS
jgi:hypothetical protein